MKSGSVFRHKKVPQLTLTVWGTVRRNEVTAVRGILSDGTRVAIPTEKLAAEWEATVSA